MKPYMTSLIALCAAWTLTACSDDDPVLTVRDWNGDAAYFRSEDSPKQDIFYKPYVGYVGDPMPFYDPVAGDFKVLYLQDYRPNPELTYHPIWGVSTGDGVSYASLGELVECGASNELDAALGTGSTIYAHGKYHIFYTAHSPNRAATGGVNEAVMVATSSDFKSWTKDRSFILTGGDEYSNADFRDPFVYADDNGLYHMLVSTRKGGKGVLAEYTSSDLRAWTSAGVFMTMMWDRFYECPDLFRMGDWWYLIYSEQHDAVRRVQYFKGRSIDELKACTANDAGIWPDSHEGFLDSRGFYAGKTASNGTERFIWGWCASRAGFNNLGTPDWGGNLVAHRLVQHTDGTLSLGELPAMAAAFPAATSQPDFTLEGMTSKLMPRLGYVSRIEFTVETSNAWDRFGFSMARGDDSEVFYSVVINPESDTLRKINFEEEGGTGFIANTDGYVFNTPADGVYHITAVIDNSVLTVYINDNVGYTVRLYGAARNCWSINSYGGNIAVKDIKISTK